MKRILFLIILTLILIGCTNTEQQACNELKNTFDDYTVNLGYTNKQISISDQECSTCPPEGGRCIPIGGEIWVGATLIEKGKIYQPLGEDKGKYHQRLTFKGNKEQGELFVSLKDNQPPYKIGRFYTFDVKHLCETLTSMVHSGTFNDHNYDRITEKECK